jgi:trehalose 6-phosphate phosphatase
MGRDSHHGIDADTPRAKNGGDHHLMAAIPKSWRRLQARLANTDFQGSRLLVGLDFDGTLAEIVDAPDKAALAGETRRLLTLLSRRSNIKIAVLSGRALQDVRSMVGLRGVYYAGNHGLEIHGPRMRWQHPRAETVGNSIRTLLEKDIEGFPGAFLEHKRLGLAIHYRNVPPRFLRRLGGFVRARVSQFKDRLRLLHSKKTFDLRPNISWDKGHALDMIRKNLPGRWMTVFVGDDRTDEEGFRTLGMRALTVRVGSVRSSAAQYVIARRRLVDRFLESLLRRSWPPAPSRHRDHLA